MSWITTIIDFFILNTFHLLGGLNFFYIWLQREKELMLLKRIKNKHWRCGDMMSNTNFFFVDNIVFIMSRVSASKTSPVLSLSYYYFDW